MVRDFKKCAFMHLDLVARQAGFEALPEFETAFRRTVESIKVF